MNIVIAVAVLIWSAPAAWFFTLFLCSLLKKLVKGKSERPVKVEITFEYEGTEEEVTQEEAKVDTQAADDVKE